MPPRPSYGDWWNGPPVDALRRLPRRSTAHREHFSVPRGMGRRINITGIRNATAEWAEPYYPYLALRNEKTVSWSNSASPLPLGAGLCARSYVANRYREEVVISPTRMRFDRRGRSLDGGGDLDLVFTARRFELGWGIFPTLKLLHLMPSGRTKKEYLLRLVESASFSMVVWSYTNGLTPPFQQGTLKKLVRTILS